MDDSIVTAQRESYWRCSPVTGSVVRRGRIGSLDCLRERCESSARASQHARTRNGASARSRSGTSTIDPAIVDRESAAFSSRWNRRFGDSVRVERSSPATSAGELAAS